MTIKCAKSMCDNQLCYPSHIAGTMQRSWLCVDIYWCCCLHRTKILQFYRGKYVCVEFGAVRRSAQTSNNFNVGGRGPMEIMRPGLWRGSNSAATPWRTGRRPGRAPRTGSGAREGSYRGAISFIHSFILCILDVYVVYLYLDNNNILIIMK